MKQRDHENQTKTEKLSSALLAQESRCLQLERELSQAHSSYTRLEKGMVKQVEDAEEQARDEREKVKKLESEVHAMEERITELLEEKENCHAELCKKQDKFLKK